MNSPNISPRRRRRMQREHQLRQNGNTLQYIADKLGVSVATVHADLRLLETNWNEFAQATRQDLLLQQITRVNRRIGRLLNRQPPGPESPLTPDEVIRIEALHTRNLNAACRKFRMLLRELPCAVQPESGEITEDEFDDYPDHELADPEVPRRNLKKPENPQPARTSKTREIEPQPASEKNSSENLNATENLPRNTGRNKPCPCGSGRKRKHCHPQSSSPPALGPVRVPPLPLSPRGAGGDAEGRGGLPTPATDLPPHLEAEAIRLTQQVHAAEQNSDPLAEIRALDKLARLYGK